MAEPGLRPREEAGWAALAEEIVRLDPPLETLFRRTVAPIDVGGAELPAGSVLRFDLAAANRDPERFPAPDAVQPGRSGRQLGYAAGRHACLGAPLARLEIAVGLRELFARLPGLVPAGPPRFRRGVIFQSTTRQPVFTGVV
jgi:cytochrome P450